MKGRLQLGSLIGLTLMLLACSSVLATSEPSFQSLPDGDYFYGDAPTPNKPGAGYMVFRKAGSSMRGLFYQEAGNLQFCFTGKDQLSIVQRVGQGHSVLDSSGGEPSSSESLVPKLFKLKFEQLPDTAAKNYQQCIR